MKCPCGRALKVPEKFAGKKVKCPECGDGCRVPAKGGATSGSRKADSPKPKRRRAAETAAAAPPPRRAKKKGSTKKKSSGTSRKKPTLLIAIIGGVVCIAVIALIAIKVFLGANESPVAYENSNQPGNATPPAPAALAELTDQVVNGVALKPAKVLDGKVELLLPSEWAPMTAELIAQKYPGKQRPAEVFSDSTTQVNLAFNHTANKITSLQVVAAQESLKRNLGFQMPNAEWLDDGFVDRGPDTWGTLDFRSQAVDTKIRNSMMVTSLDDRMLIVSFNATAEMEPKWEPVRQAIMDSIRLAHP